MSSTVTRPVLRYHGGKWRLAEWIISSFPSHAVYVEPFGGAASVLLQKEPAAIEVYNDLDQGIVNLFRVLRSPARAAELQRALSLTPFSRAEFESAYDKEEGNVVEECRRLVLRMGQSIGNKSRTQRSGWRTRTAKSKISPCNAWTGWPDNMPAIVDRLRHTILECLPWQKIVELYDDSNALFYLDPPYPSQTRSRNHKNMYAFEMAESDHIELLETVNCMKGMIALSTYPSELYVDRLKGWTMLQQKSRAQGNVQRLEILWLNPLAAERTHQGRIFGNKDGIEATA